MTPQKRNRIPFYNPLDPLYQKIWPGYTLIVPVCAVGNVGQLACDLIISTLLSRQECHLIGRLHSPALMSLVGPNAFAPKGPPTTSTEVYESKKHKLVIIQQRTSYFKSLKHIYIAELVDWIRVSKFDQVLVLSSSFAQCNPDTSLLGDIGANSAVASIITSVFEPDDRWTKLNLKIIPEKHTLKVVQDGMSFLPGSGITKPLLKACEKASIKAATVVIFCSEGINLVDCYKIANIIDQLFVLNESSESNQPGADEFEDQLKRQLWVEPFSWAQTHC